MKKAEIKICMGSSCFARGNDRYLEIIEKYIKDNHAEDYVDLMGLRCGEKCSDGPHIYINGIDYHEIDESLLDSVINI